MIALQASGQQIQQRLHHLPDSDWNRRVLSHIISIERWSQRRLRVALGELFVHDEYDGYRPPRDATWDILKSAFFDVRRETVRLVGALERADAAEGRVPHNSYGDLTVRGWLRYVDVHASFESRKMHRR